MYFEVIEQMWDGMGAYVRTAMVFATRKEAELVASYQSLDGDINTSQVFERKGEAPYLDSAEEVLACYRKHDHRFPR